MKKLIVGLLVVIVLLLAWNMFSSDNVDERAQDAASIPTITTTEGFGSLMVEHASLIMQAGNLGMDVRDREDWSERAQATSVMISEGKYDEAVANLSAINKEMRAAIADLK